MQINTSNRGPDMRLQTPNGKHQRSPKQHRGLGFLRVLVFGLVAGAVTLVAAEQKFKNVGVEEFDKLRKQTNSIVLDVRTSKEFVAGHIPGATNIDWYASDFEKK